MLRFQRFAVRGSGVITQIVPQGAFGLNTELSNVLGPAAELDAENERFFGNVSIEVLNIAPRYNGTVQVRINVLFDSPLNMLVALDLCPVNS